jgi:hypothetical protein
MGFYPSLPRYACGRFRSARLSVSAVCSALGSFEMDVCASREGQFTSGSDIFRSVNGQWAQGRRGYTGQASREWNTRLRQSLTHTRCHNVIFALPSATYTPHYFTCPRRPNKQYPAHQAPKHGAYMCLTSYAASVVPTYCHAVECNVQYRRPCWWDMYTGYASPRDEMV